MKQRGLIFNSRPNKTIVLALGLMLGLCPASRAWLMLIKMKIR